MSHDPRPENTPMCDYFARCRCHNEQCKFTHMTNLSDVSSICRTFALNGWCDKGAKCNKRHSYQCPEFDAHGNCANRDCKLEHVIEVKEEPRTQKKDFNAINLKQFLRFLENTTREKYDAETRHVASLPPNFEEIETAEEYACEGFDDSEPEFASDWDGGGDSTGEELDMNADFIEV